MKRKKKQYTAEEKVAILRKHLLDKVAVSDVCEEYGVRPGVFYRWQKASFENGAQAFQHGQEQQTAQLKERIAELEAKLTKKNEVLGAIDGELGGNRGAGSSGGLCAVLVTAHGTGS